MSKSAIRRLSNAGKGTQPPVGLAPYGSRTGNMFQLGTGRASKEQQLRAYGMSGTIFAIVNLLSSSTAAPDWNLYKKQPVDGRRRYSTADAGDDQRVQVLTSPALSLWNQPNAYMSGFEFREMSNQHFFLAGETFWVLEREGVNFPTSMWPVRPDRMEVVSDPNGWMAGWMYMSFDGQQVPLKLDQVIQEKMPDPLDPFRGMSPIAAIMPNIQQQRYATDYQRNLFINGADPGGVISFPAKVEDRDYDQFVDRWRESHQGVSNAGRVGVLEMGATWTNGGMTNKDLEYSNLRLTNRDEEREAYRIHKHMLGTVDDVNRANAETAEDNFYDDLVIPCLKRRENTLNDKLLPMFYPKGAVRPVEFDFDNPAPERSAAATSELLIKAQALAAMVDAGMDPHDALEMVGLPDAEFVETAVQAPMAPPGWVPEPPAAPALPSAAKPEPDAAPDDITDLMRSMRHLVGLNGHSHARSN